MVDLGRRVSLSECHLTKRCWSTCSASVVMKGCSMPDHTYSHAHPRMLGMGMPERVEQCGGQRRCPQRRLEVAGKYPYMHFLLS